MQKLLKLGSAFAAICAVNPAHAALTFDISGTYDHSVYNRADQGPLGLPPFDFEVKFTLVAGQQSYDGTTTTYYGPVSSLTVNGNSLPAYPSIGLEVTGHLLGINFAALIPQFIQFSIVYAFPLGTDVDISSQALFSNYAPDHGLLSEPFDSFDELSNVRVSVSGTTPEVTILPPPGPIPEPVTWAMMIAGYGLVGAAMRLSSTKLRYG